MIWLHAEDNYYYQEEQIQELKEEYKLEELLIIPTEDEIRAKQREYKKFGVISYYDVPRGAEGYFVYKKLMLMKKILTTQQELYNIDEGEALFQRYGMKTYKPSKTFADYGGGHGLKHWYAYVQKLKANGLPVKPIFLLGVQGSGKSEFVLCYAGESNSLMIDLNLSLLMEDLYPLKKLNQLFEFCADTGIRATYRIDEITEMLQSEVLFGELLTLLNDLNTKEGYELNGELFASANRIDEVNAKKPQFFRQGRWNKKFFITYPTKQEAIEIMHLYSNKYGNNFSDDDILRIYQRSLISHKSTTLPNLSPYTPAEINVLMLELTQYDGYDNDLFEAHIKNFIPQTRSAMEGTYGIIQAQEELCFEVLNKAEGERIAL